jgi:aryl hydrocarbon receptor nuclear translocator
LTPAERQSLQVEKDFAGACLVAVARLQHFGSNLPQATLSSDEKEFIARVGTDGRFTYVDPRVSSILGYLPQDLIGHNSYDYYHPDDVQKMVQLHHEAMKQRGPMPTVHYRFLSKNQKWIWLAMKAFSFINPFSQHIEYVVCTNVVHTRSMESGESSSNTGVVEPQSSSNAAESSSIVRPHSSTTSSGTGPMRQHHMPQQEMVTPPDMTAPPNITNWINRLYTEQPTPSTSNGRRAEPSNVVLMQPADTTVQENALATQKIVDNYLKQVMPPPHRKDMNYEFPPGLFTDEVDLEGSAQAYYNLIEGLENSSDFQQLLNQVDADPFKTSSNVFTELDLDIFD